MGEERKEAVLFLPKRGRKKNRKEYISTVLRRQKERGFKKEGRITRKEGGRKKLPPPQLQEEGREGEKVILSSAFVILLGREGKLS